MKPRVFLTRRLPPAVMERLTAEAEFSFNAADHPLRPDELIAHMQGQDAVIPNVVDRLDADVLAACAGLKVIANFGVGYNNIDVAAATKRKIVVTNTPGVLTDATADIAFGLLLGAARRFSEGDRLVRSRAWTGWEPMQLLGQDLAGATLGLLGCGRIGQAVAKRARGFDLRVCYWNRTRLSKEQEQALQLEFLERDVLLASSDFISIHVAYVPETHHLIDARALSQMKPNCVIVNTARGPVVDERALVEALREKRIAAAGLDVFEREPQLEPELHDLPNCLLLPHLGSGTIGTRTKMGMLCVDNLLAFFRGRRPPHCVNPEVLD